MSRQCPCSESTTPENRKKKQVSQWEAPMRAFWEKHEEKCRNGGSSVAAPSTNTIMDFPTGSSYKGGYEDSQMCGYGEYTYPNGVLYRGEFENGMCHGDGNLVYDNGPDDYTVMRGKWEKGFLKGGQVFFGGTLEYDTDDWQYCRMPDRRYSTEFDDELQPAGKSNITADQPPREIPPGLLDNGYGFYNPKTKFIYKYRDFLELSKAASEREQAWIEENCRMEPVKKVGPRPDLYETWLEPDVDPEPLPGLLVGFIPRERPSMYASDYDDIT